MNYLGAVYRAASQCSQPILECGSGLSTLLLGLIGDERGVAVHTLENQPEWAQRVSTLLDALGIQSVRLHYAPLRDYGTFQWYEEPAGLPGAFGLVVCDGPRARTTRGGRYGLLPVLHRRLTEETVVLMDDVGRPSEQVVLERWRRQFGIVRRTNRSAGGNFAVLNCAACACLPAPGGRP